jgi:hypothetical protein
MIPDEPPAEQPSPSRRQLIKLAGAGAFAGNAAQP